MNISTYEARIKALEDQLNPPGPSGGVAIESITLSPDINGINTILADTQFNYEDGVSMGDGAPAWARGFNIVRTTTETMPSTVEVTVTPRDDLYVMYKDQQQGTFAHGEKGETVTFTAHKTSDTGEKGKKVTFTAPKTSDTGNFRISLVVTNTNDISTADYGVFVDIVLQHTA